MIEIERFIVVTGGPGSGKTTLVEALRARGLAAMPEAGRAIIQGRRRSPSAARARASENGPDRVLRIA